MVKHNNKSKNKTKHPSLKGRGVSNSVTYRHADGDNVTDEARGSRGIRGCTTGNTLVAAATAVAAAATSFDGTDDDYVNDAELPNKSRTPRIKCDSDSKLTQDLLRIISSFTFRYRIGLMKLSSAIAFTAILSTVAVRRGFYYTPWLDVFVYCGVYSVWVITCLPWLLTKLNIKTLGLIAGVMTRLFGADIGILGWAAWRGDTEILHRGLRLKPVMEPSLSWLTSAGYSLRFGVVVAVVAATVVKLTLDSKAFTKLAASKRFSVSPTKQSFSPPPSTRLRSNRTNATKPGSLTLGLAGAREADIYPTTTGINNKSSTGMLHQLEDSIRHITSSIPREDPTYFSKRSPDTVPSPRPKKEKHKKRYTHFGSPTNVHGQIINQADISENNSKLKNPSKTRANLTMTISDQDDKEKDNSEKDSGKSLTLSDMCRKLLKKETTGSRSDKFEVNNNSPENGQRHAPKSKFTLKHKNKADDIDCRDNKQEVKIENTSKGPVHLKKRMNKPSVSPTTAPSHYKTSCKRTNRPSHRTSSRHANSSLNEKSAKQTDVDGRVKRMALFNEKVRQLELNKQERTPKKRSQSEQPSGSRAANGQLNPTNEFPVDRHGYKTSLSGKQKMATGNYVKNVSRRKSVCKSTADDKK